MLAFDCPLQSSATLNGINSNRLTIPGPEPATQGFHVFQAIFQASGATPGKSINICYSSSTVAQPADGTGNGLCQSVLITRDASPNLRVKALTQSTIQAGGRVVLGAQVVDEKDQPIAGLPVTFKAATTDLGIVSCATNADFNAGKVQFKPIVTDTTGGPGSSQPLGPNGPSPLPSANVAVASPDQINTPIGGPLPGTDPQNTPNGYQCYAGSGAALGASPLLAPTTPTGLLPSQHEVSVLADADGVAVATFLSLPNAKPGQSAKVVAEVYQGVSDKPVARADAPPIQFGAGAREAGVSLKANPKLIALTNPTPNASDLTACAAGTLGNGASLPVASSARSQITFAIVSRTPENLDAAFAQTDGNGSKAQVTVPTDSDGCAKTTVIASGAGSVTVSATLAGAETAAGTATLTLPVGTALAEAGQPGFFSDTPNGTRAVCPNVGVWALLYWQGGDTPIETAMLSCLTAGRYWVRRGSQWIAAKSGDKAASDMFTVGKGEAVLVFGSK
jgi:hypothetical protein